MKGKFWLILALTNIVFCDPVIAATCTVPGTHNSVAAAISDSQCNPVTVASGVWGASILITRDLTLQGAGPAETVLIGKPNQPVIEIAGPIVLQLEGVRLTSGPLHEPAMVVREQGRLTMSDVSIVLSSETFTVGGSVGGLVGTGLVLQINDGDNLAIGSDGDFTFPNALLDGSPYTVKVLTQPTSPAQTCSVSNGSGVLEGDNVTDATISCAAVADEIFADGFEESL